MKLKRTFPIDLLTCFVFGTVEGHLLLQTTLNSDITCGVYATIVAIALGLNMACSLSTYKKEYSIIKRTLAIDLFTCIAFGVVEAHLLRLAILNSDTFYENYGTYAISVLIALGVNIACILSTYTSNDKE